MDAPDLSKEPYAQAVQVSPLVRRVLAHNPSPFSYTGTQTYIVGTTAGDYYYYNNSTNSFVRAQQRGGW